MTGLLSREVEFEFVDGAEGGSFVTTDRVRGVIMAHLTSGAVDKAASMIATSAPEIGDALLDKDMRDASVAVREALAAAFVQARDFERAGRAALLIGDPGRAAPLFEKSYDFARAAELYEKSGKHERAAELWERNLQFERAAQLYESSGQHERAATAWEKAGGLYQAARLWAQLRRLDRAIEPLQKIRPDSPEWVPGVALLGRILEHAGQRDVAAARYIEVVKSRPLDTTTIEVYERLGEIYAATGHEGPARKLLSAVLKLNPGRERAQKALAALGGGPTSVSPGSMASPGVGMAPASSASPPLSGGSAGPSAGDGGVRPLVLPGGPALAPAATNVMVLNEDVDALRQLPLLAELSLDELRALCAIGERRRWAPGEILIEQDRDATDLIVVLAGSVGVSRVTGAVEAPLVDLGYGASLGEMALVDEGPTYARVRARTEVTGFRWPMERLRGHLKTNEGTALRLLRVISRTLSVRLRETNRLVQTR
jgi:tetratricopeptide (TPR) repeat protein